MSSYNVTRRTLRHRQGSKEYHFLAIDNVNSGESLLVLRWGKTNAWGQMQVHVGTKAAMLHLLNTKTREKEKGGYNQINNNTSAADDVTAVKKLATVAYWSKLGADNIKKVMPEADTTGVVDPTEVEFEEDAKGNFKAKHTVRPHPDFHETEEAKAAREEAEAKTKQAADPLWGMF